MKERAGLHRDVVGVEFLVCRLVNIMDRQRIRRHLGADIVGNQHTVPVENLQSGYDGVAAHGIADVAGNAGIMQALIREVTEIGLIIPGSSVVYVPA